MAGAQAIGSLYVALGMDSAAFSEGVKRVQSVTSGLQESFAKFGAKATSMGKSLSVVTGAMAAVGGAASALVIKMSSIGKEISMQSQLANAGTTEFQRWAAGAKTVGIENDKLSDILKDVNDRVGEFVSTGGGPMKDFFDNVAPKVGVTADAFKDLSGPQALQLFVSSLEKAGLSQQEMTFYMEAMASDSTALMEISKLQFNEDGMSFDLEAVSVQSEDFDFVATSEEPDRPDYDKVVTSDNIDVIAAFTGVALSASNSAANILWSWEAQDGSYNQQIRYMSAEAGINDWQIVSASSGADQTTYVMSGLIDGAQYQAQIRNLTSGGRTGAWAPDTPVIVTAIANAIVPGNITDFTASADGSNVVISWIAPNDENYFGTRIYAINHDDASDVPNISDATLIHTEYGIPSSGDSYTDTGGVAGYHYYWGVPINSSGVAGATVGPALVLRGRLSAGTRPGLRPARRGRRRRDLHQREQRHPVEDAGGR